MQRRTRTMRTALAASMTLGLAAVALAPGSASTPAPSAPLTGGAAPSSATTPPLLGWSVVSVRPHDVTAFTEGLLLDADGRLFESTGLYGRSTVREVDPSSGQVLAAASLPEDLFGEGLALVGDELLQLTWREGQALRWSRDGLLQAETSTYDGEGWGLCFDGQRLVMSDGSELLTFRDPETFAVIGQLPVTHPGDAVLQLNELECRDGDVWANAWLTDIIVRIDATSGAVTGWLDLGPLHDAVLAAVASPAPSPGAGVVVPEAPDVLNGIAWDASAGTFLVTGKRWPVLIEIRVDDVTATD